MARWTKGPKLLADRLQKIQRKVVRATAGETGVAVRRMDSQLKKRTFPAKQISKQDSPSGQDQKLPKVAAHSVDWTSNQNGIVIKLVAKAIYTAARTLAIISVFARLGRANQLVRDSLLVRRRRGGPIKRISLNADPKLKAWAERPERGRQIRRHVVLADKPVLAILSVGPTVEKSQRALLAAWKRGLKNGFVG